MKRDTLAVTGCGLLSIWCLTVPAKNCRDVAKVVHLCTGDELMIKCNLSRLMGDKKQSIQDVHRATGISRTTLTRLYYETNDAIHYETLNKLCRGCTNAILVTCWNGCLTVRRLNDEPTRNVAAS
jgi:putative transcriptional regulator